MNLISVMIDLEERNINFAVKRTKATGRIYNTLSFPQDKIKTFSAALSYFRQHVSDDGLLPAEINVIIPSDYVITEPLNLPTLQRNKTIGAAQTEINNYYKNFDDFNYKTSWLSSDKDYTIILYRMLKKSMIQQVYEGLVGSGKTTIKYITHEANCLINSILALLPDYRKSDFFAIDVQPNKTLIALAINGSTTIYFKMPIGYSAPGGFLKSVDKRSPTGHYISFIYDVLVEMQKAVSSTCNQVLVRAPQEYIQEFSKLQPQFDCKYPDEFNAAKNPVLFGGLFCGIFNGENNF